MSELEMSSRRGDCALRLEYTTFDCPNDSRCGLSRLMLFLVRK
jgi:hypothetical protein